MAFLPPVPQGVTVGFVNLKTTSTLLLLLLLLSKENTPGGCFERLPSQNKSGREDKNEIGFKPRKNHRLLPVDCHGPWRRCFERREDASPVSSPMDLLLAASCISWSDFRSYPSAEIGPQEHARARSPGVKHSSPPQKVARSPTSPNGARSRTCTRSR